MKKYLEKQKQVLTDLLKENNETVWSLSNKMNISRSSLNYWVSGKHAMKLTDYFRILEYFGIGSKDTDNEIQTY